MAKPPVAERLEHETWTSDDVIEFFAGIEHVTMVEADRFHREHAVVELAIRDLKEGAGLEHIPSGHFHANAAWLGCSVLAHNLGIGATLITGQATVTGRTRRTRLIALAAVIVNRSGRHLLRFPTGWPWADQFTTMLRHLRSLPAPASG